MLGKIKERWVPSICKTIPFSVWHRINSIRLVVPHWHIVSDQEVPHVNGLYRSRNIRQFRADLEFFLQNYFPVTEVDVIRHLYDGLLLPPRSVLFTFDDGFREINDVVAPILRAKGIPAVFFLITSTVDNKKMSDAQKKSLLVNSLSGRQSSASLDEANRLLSLAGVSPNSNLTSRIRAVSFHQRHVLDGLERVLNIDFQWYLTTQKPYLSSEHVEELVRQGFGIGAHSVDHPLYEELSLDQQLVQTRESIRWLSEHFRIQCCSFAFPYRDSGVSLDFFRVMYAEGEMKLSFGTGGLIPHPFPYNLPRFSLERTDLTAAEVLAGQFGRRFIRWKLGISYNER